MIMNAKSGEDRLPPVSPKSKVQSLFAAMREIKAERSAAVAEAVPALQRLVEVMRHKTNQSEHVRSMLYSAWSGAPTALIEIPNLDWKVRKDLLAVLAAFGNEDFFYDEIKTAIRGAGLFDWFCRGEFPKEGA